MYLVQIPNSISTTYRMPDTKNIENVFDFILENPSQFRSALPPFYVKAGNVSTSSKSEFKLSKMNLPPLDGKRLLRSIWKSSCEQIREQLESGYSVNIKNFGSFTFEPENKEYPTPHGEHIQTIVMLNPCFLVGNGLKEAVSQKKEVIQKQCGSIYQHGVRMTFLNPVSVAKRVLVEIEPPHSVNFQNERNDSSMRTRRPEDKIDTKNYKYISSSIESLFEAINILAQKGTALDIDFRFCRFMILDKNLSVKFSIKQISMSKENIQKKIEGFEEMTDHVSDVDQMTSEGMKPNSLGEEKGQKSPSFAKVHSYDAKGCELDEKSKDLNTCLGWAG